MGFRIVLDPQAIEDIDETTRFIVEQGNPDRAEKWKSGVFAAIRMLSDFPSRYSVIPEAKEVGIEFRHLHFHSHRIVFAINEESQIVIVARVYHGARRSLRLSNLS